MTSVSWPFLLLLSAVGLLILEIFIPSGGVLGILSGITLVASIAAAYFYGGLELGTYFLVGTSLLIPALIYLSIKLWPKTPIGRLILNQPKTADQVLPKNLTERQQWLGRRGTALSPMLPSGAIRIEDKTLDAISDGVVIDKGTNVEVVAIRGNYLVVRAVRDDVGPSPSATTNLGADKAGHPSTSSPLDKVIQDPFDDSLS